MCELCLNSSDRQKLHGSAKSLSNEIGDLPADASTTARIEVGDVFVGRIEAFGDRDWVRVSLREGYVYDISLTASGDTPLTDPVLRLYDIDGNLLATNDDIAGSGNRNSLLDDFVAGYTGDFFIEAAGYNDRHAGGYTIAVVQDGEPPLPDTIPADSSTTVSLGVGDSFTSALETVGDRDWIRIDLELGKSYDIALSGSGETPLFDPILRVYDRDGNLLVTRDDIDGNRNRNSFLDEFSPRYTGTYYIEAAAFGDKHAGQYTIEVTAGDKQGPYTYNQIARYLSSGFWQEFLEVNALALPVGEDRVVSYNISKLTAAGKKLAVEAFRVWADVTGLVFQRTTEAAMIDFDDAERGAYASLENTGTVIDSAAINIGRSWLRDYGTSLDSYSFQTYIHEIGHTLGLGHAGNYNGSARYPDDALYANDSWQATVMSYFDQAENYFINDSVAFLLTPMIADIIAVQSIYGFAGATRPGDTVYGHGTNAGRLFDPRNFAEPVALTIYDSGGQDRLSGAETTANQLINLRPEGISDMFGLTGNVSIARGTWIEEAVGGSGDDLIIGNAVANGLWGGDGNDTLRGGNGNDVLRGGAGNDVLYGGAGDDRLQGGSGADLLVGGSGRDVFVYTGNLDSPVGGFDRIADFTAGEDVIDLAAIDARPGGSDDAFDWLDQGRFTGAGGELRWVETASGVRLLADIDGDRKADMMIVVPGVTVLGAADFIL